jgi:phosphatidylglycerol lysyltransferase
MRHVERAGIAGRLRGVLPTIIGLFLLAAALEVLRTELRTFAWPALTQEVLCTPPRALGLMLALTLLNYAALTGYDFLALASIGKRLPLRQVMLTSFVAYAVANNVGWAMLSGASVRYRFYSRWGITAEELLRIVFSYSVTFWIGLLLLGGLSVTVSPFLVLLDAPLRRVAELAGWALMLACLGFLIATFVRREPIRLRRVELQLPSPRLASAQLTVSVVDWALAGAVLYALLPASGLSFVGFLGAFLAAQLIGLVSHVPGGVGVFESLMVLFLSPFLEPAEIVPSLLMYRAVYYLLPLIVASVVLAVDELQQRRGQATRLYRAMSLLARRLTPCLLAAATFLSGVILLFSGATPAAAGRLSFVNRVLPLGVIEMSHFIGSLLGAALLLLSQGLARRLDAAYFLSLAAVVAGIAASLLKGADYEEAAVLAVVFLMLWQARHVFNRRAAFYDTRFSTGWILAIVSVMAASIWLGLFAFQHVEYSNQLWWQFELRGEASRFLRASVGAAVVLGLFALRRLVGHAPHEAVSPSDAELDAAGAIIATQTSTVPYLVYLRDKAVLFDASKTGFVMYGVKGRTWVALGDPVGAPESAPDLIRRFLERCHDFGGTPVFYEVRKEHLYRYADFGLTFVKLGEDALVDLRRFTLDGGRARKFRQALRRLEKEGATFRVVPSHDIPSIIDQLRAVSDDWLRERRAAEKGFSLGLFDADYLARFPAGVVERNGRVVAFANLWPGPQQAELSLDLMRHHHDAPKEVMEGLFVHLMKWGQAQGYECLSLGMAPLSGFERSPVAPLWNRLGSFFYRHGGAFYNFQGLRAFKDKFDPEWEPRYLVYPGGLKLARVLADVAALVAGGYRRILLT